jgi:hypothetical protein
MQQSEELGLNCPGTDSTMHMIMSSNGQREFLQLPVFFLFFLYHRKHLDLERFYKQVQVVRNHLDTGAENNISSSEFKTKFKEILLYQIKSRGFGSGGGWRV